MHFTYILVLNFFRTKRSLTQFSPTESVMHKGSDAVELVVCTQCGARVTFKIGGVTLDFCFLAVRHIAEQVLDRLLLDETISQAGYQEGLVYVGAATELYESKEELEQSLLNGQKMDKYLAACHPRDSPHNLKFEVPRRFQPATTLPASTARKGRGKQQRARV